MTETQLAKYFTCRECGKAEPRKGNYYNKSKGILSCPHCGEFNYDFAVIRFPKETEEYLETLGIWYQFGVYMREQKEPEIDGACEDITQEEMDRIIEEWVDKKLRTRGIDPEKLF